MKKPQRTIKMAGRKSAVRPKPRASKGAKRLISRAEARKRAERHVLNRMFKGATVRDGAGVRLNIYHRAKWKSSDVWIVYKNPDNPQELKSSDIVAVCKRTGRVLYEGSAGDEG